jgi:hypothetical protein
VQAVALQCWHRTNPPSRCIGTRMRRPHTLQLIVKKLLVPRVGERRSSDIASLPDGLMSDSNTGAGVTCEPPRRLPLNSACYHFTVLMLDVPPRFHGTFIEVERAIQ